jgi:hypothetical protein
MMGAALVIHPDGGIIDVNLNPGRSHLALKYEHLNCAAVDVVPLTSVLDMWFDPDGPARQPFNGVATSLARHYGRTLPYFGPVLICGCTPQGASADLDRAQVRALLTRLQDVTDRL